MLPFLHVPMDVAQQAYFQPRIEERIRMGSDLRSAETELNPLLRYDFIWKGGQNHFVALYNPRFVYTNTFSTPFSRGEIDPNVVSLETINKTDPNDTPFSALNNGGAGLVFVRRRYSVSLYQFAAYGPITTTALLVQAPWDGAGPPPDPQPIVPSTIAGRFTLLFLQSTLSVPIRLSPRVALTPNLVYNAFGGATSASRGVIALTSGPGANVALDVQATRDDRLTTTIGAGRITTDFEGDRQGAIIYRAEGSQAWRHWYTRNVSTELLGGASVGGDAISGFSAFGIGSASLIYDSYPLFRLPPGAPPQGGPPGHGPRVQIGITAKALPWIDLFSGELEPRAVGTAATNFTFDRTTLRLAASSARVIPNERSVARYQIWLAESSLRYGITETFFADLGVRFGYQDFSNAIRSNQLTQATVFVAFQLLPLPARF
ncbi:MAG: hypothetical protein JST00_03365 [Deltaproteobacteria bacterium]|nr:hypothetical protein [Deltaproteobacteria bacterium]